MSKNIGKYFHQEMDNQAAHEHATHRTKIVATVGPACDSYEKLLELVRAGVNVFRLNFSHGAHEDKKRIIDSIRKISVTEPYNIAILGDLQGPKLRVGEIENNALHVKEGDILTFTNEKMVGTMDRIYVSYPNLAGDVVLGNTIMIDDGKIEVVVKEIVPNGDVRPRIAPLEPFEVVHYWFIDVSELESIGRAPDLRCTGCQDIAGHRSAAERQVGTNGTAAVHTGPRDVP